MKKILSTALIAVVLSTMIVDTVSAARSKNAPAVRRGRGGRRASMPAKMRANSKKVQMALETAKKTDNPAVKQQALKTANELSKELLMELQDRTWAGDVLGKYTPEQVANAGEKYAQLAVQKEQLTRDIDSKQAELDAMTVKGYIWNSVEGGKEAAHKVASQELAELKSTLRDVNKAMRDQAVIAGKEYCNSVRMAIGAMTAVAIAGGVALIDQVATGGEYRRAGMKRAGEAYEAGKEFAGKEYAAMKAEGRGYISRRGGEAYGAITGGLSSMKTYATNRITAIKDYVSSYWKPADKPAEVKEAETAAIKDRKEADAAAKKSEQNPENKTLATEADSKEVTAMNSENNLVEVVEANASN